MKKSVRTTDLKSSFVLMFFVLDVPSQVCWADERMNVLFLCVDDLNTWLLPDPNRYTGKVVAPSIRKLAGEGVLFTRAYCAAPKCSPSRTAVLSGVAPWKSGIYQNSQINDDSPALKTAVSNQCFCHKPITPIVTMMALISFGQALSGLPQPRPFS